MRRSFGSKRPVEQVPGKANFQKPTPASVIKGAVPTLGIWRFSFPNSKPSFGKSWNPEKKISRIHQYVGAAENASKKGIFNKYVKISSRNFDICQRFPEYGEKKEKSCHILHKVNSIIGHLEIFFSKFKTFLQEVLEFGEENIQDR